LAPFIPFTAESIYQNLVREAVPDAPISVHMCDWHQPREDLIDPSLESQMDLVRDVVEAVSNARQKGGRKLRWPVSNIIISPNREIAELDSLINVLKNQTNSKAVVAMAPGEKPPMNMALNPIPKKIGPAFKGEAQKVIQAIKAADPLKVKADLETGSCKVESYAIDPEMVEFLEEIPENLVAADFSSGTVYVDITLTDDLKAEGYAREIIRRIQDMRKEMDLNVEDKIIVRVQVGDEDVSNLVLGLKEKISSEVRSKDTMMGTSIKVDGSLVKNWSVEGVDVSIGITHG